MSWEGQDWFPRKRLSFLALTVLLLETWASTEYDPEARVESARIYGNVNAYAYYFTDILVGSPKPQLTSVIIDTGSHLLGFPCTGCEHCGNHLEPAIDMSLSTTARWLGCGGGCRGSCEEGKCAYSEGYSEGSHIRGHWFEDYVELGDSISKNPPVRVTMGCHTSENNLFYTQRANGIMGLAPSSYHHPSQSTPTILDELFQDKKSVDSSVFSICLAQWGGLLTVGGYNTPHHLSREGAGIQWTSMQASRYYFVFPATLKVADMLVAADKGEFGLSIIDTGTTLTYFPAIIYDTMVADLASYCLTHAGCGAVQAPSPNCWNLEGDQAGPGLFPPIRISFEDGAGVDWPAKSYLTQRGSNTWCYAFDKHNRQETIFGISWILHRDAIFDLRNQRFGLAEASCPEHRKVPQLWGSNSLGRFPFSQAFMGSSRMLVGALLGALLLVTLIATVSIRLIRHQSRCLCEGGELCERAAPAD
ncbi:unnamed protein product [Polarella glacialis]|uniref:Peptidase A1 domain-containing protein n=1 Tax=Polarella glacialis TaxID=89957 RepID=A0A813EU15_POLGL|nr:unnamed protein product [Polarella glacialis]